MEAARASHEHVEKLENLIVAELYDLSSTATLTAAHHDENLIRSHRVRNYIDQTVTISRNLAVMYQNNEHIEEELSGNNNTQSNVFAEFHDRLKDIRNSNKLNTNTTEAKSYDGIESQFETPEIKFSSEECFGRYVDLHEHFNRYINVLFHSKQVNNSGYVDLDYIAYLDTLLAADTNASSELRSSDEYKSYLAQLLCYLESFMERTQPLTFLDRMFCELEEEFERTWNVNSRKRKRQREDMWKEFNTTCRTVEEVMEELGPQRLKEALKSLGLKSGGTLKQRAERLLLATNNSLDKIHPKHFAKEANKETLLLEAKVKRYCEILKETIQKTKERVRNRQVMTVTERLADGLSEIDDFNSNEDEEAEDDNGASIMTIRNNVLNLPLGFDGKPIPYWLYKLHGLDKRFDCEICGNYTYKGRMAFERHFKEDRHLHGMRCLGIPNTKSFYEITNIDDARELWEEIRSRQELTKWRPQVDEECEDNEGNIYNKKTYMDLQRQGLL